MRSLKDVSRASRFALGLKRLDARTMINSRVIFLLDEFLGPVNGTEAQFWLLYNALVADSGWPNVATLRHSQYLTDRLPAGSYENLSIGSLFSLSSILKAFQFARRSRKAGVKVAHLYLNDVSILMPLFLWLVGIRVIVSRRDLGFWYTKPILRVLRVQRHFVARAIANCAAVKAAVIAAEGYEAAQVPVFLNGVEPPVTLGPGTYRQDFGVPANAVVLGMVANLRKLKRVDDAVHAIAGLKAQGLDAWLMVAGDDRVEEGVSQREALTELAAKLGVLDRVRFVGMINPSWSFLAEIDVFLSCSDTEGLSNSIIEAMICKKPVIGTNVGGTPELITHESSGFLYEPADLKALTEYAALLVFNKNLRAAMGRAGSDFAQRTLSTQALLAAHVALYAQLAGGRSK
jgi:L-malate glycosyltransferase